MVDVTQEDREAAARYWGNDNPPLELQREFARHRIAARNAAIEEAAATITDLRARVAELEADKAQWVEIERMQLGVNPQTQD